MDDCAVDGMVEAMPDGVSAQADADPEVVSVLGSCLRVEASNGCSAIDRLAMMLAAAVGGGPNAQWWFCDVVGVKTTRPGQPRPTSSTDSPERRVRRSPVARSHRIGRGCERTCLWRKSSSWRDSSWCGKGHWRGLF